MRKMTFTLVTFICLLVVGRASCAATMVDHAPPEMIVLKLPDSFANWKAISRNVTEEEGLAEYIPLKQTPENWTELICFQYFGRSLLDQGGETSIEKIMNLLMETTIDRYPGNKVTWKILRKSEDNAIYEWILHEPHKNIAPQHEVVRIFLTNTGMYRVGFTRRNREMASIERQHWIDLLGDCVSLVNTEGVQSSPNGLSILDRLKDSVDLGEAFDNWKVTDTYTFETGYAMVIRVPPSSSVDYVTESLEVATAPNASNCPLTQGFEIEKKSIMQLSERKAKFHVLKQTDQEIIYKFVYPQRGSKITGVTRTILSDRGYCSISHKSASPSELKPKEVQMWRRRLEAVKIRD